MASISSSEARMREPAFLGPVNGHLRRHGLPADRVERITRELAEHWEDLRDAALDRGISENEAADEADARMGRPEQLSRAITDGLRQSSWLGRHPVLALCLLPFLAVPLLMAVVVLPLSGLDELAKFEFIRDASGRVEGRYIAGVLLGLYYLTMVGVAAGFCWRVWRSGLGFRWIPAVCAWCALASLVRFLRVDTAHRTVTAGFRFPWRFDEQTAVILLLHGLIALLFLLMARRGASAGMPSEIPNETMNPV